MPGIIILLFTEPSGKLQPRDMDAMFKRPGGGRGELAICRSGPICRMGALSGLATIRPGKVDE